MAASRRRSPPEEDYEAERDRLRSECSTLFDKKIEIEERLKENQIRLRWLDDRIDGTGVSAVDDERCEEYDDNGGPRLSSGADGGRGGKFAMMSSFTQAEDLLTDPHTQPPLEDDHNSRRVSTSPPMMTKTTSLSGTMHSKTPPGLRPSAAPIGGEKRVNEDNPFGDLWDRNEGPRDHAGGGGGGKRRRADADVGGGANTLEKYFVGVGPTSHAPAAAAASAAARGAGASSFATAATENVRTSSRSTTVMMRRLRETFGIEKFRDHQGAIIDATMSGEDVFVVMRTGGGKSLTYQLPAVLECFDRGGVFGGGGGCLARKVTVVISPLVSLIRDQEEQMNRMIPGSAMSFTSGMAGGTSEHARRWGLVRDPNGGVALIFVTPEKVGQSTKFKGEMEKLHDQGRLGRFVIDECHCACQWGHDFRPDYTKLGILKHHFPRIPVLAVTATASERVRHDCAQILRLGQYKFFRSSANRPNLIYSVRCKPDSKEAVVKDMVAFIRENHVGQAGIIYTFSRKEADDVASGLCDNGIVAHSYHSDVSETRKDQVQRSWMRNETQVVVATIAFGLGINKPDVRFVLHHTLSKSLEAYYQESGRAGRDGDPASCVLYYSPKDVPKMLGMIHGDAGECTFWAMAKYGQAFGDDALCRHVILATLGEADDSMGMTLINLENNCTTTVHREVGAHCQTAAKVVDTLNKSGEDCTINQIVAKWRSKSSEGNFSFLKDNPPGDLSKDECERIIIYLLLEDVLHPRIIYTAYNTIVYIVLGPKGPGLVASRNPRARISFPNIAKRKQADPKRSPINPLAVADEGGWITAKSTKTTKPKSTNTKQKAKVAGKVKGKAIKSKKTKKVPKRKSTGSKVPTIVEINSSSSSSSSESDDDDVILAKRQTTTKKKKRELVITDDTSDDSDYVCSD